MTSSYLCVRALPDTFLELSPQERCRSSGDKPEHPSRGEICDATETLRPTYNRLSFPETAPAYMGLCLLVTRNGPSLTETVPTAQDIPLGV
jgi:hypothetical protein